ncbi:MAG: GNAT family N-acetyltransferase [Lachnospiraceae bacterium]|nr:GNAT family N-acetyltransferase [Lachnospiraceae bacterium]MDE6815030.1 GNAT family N-acetyltransferase [Lachnospiraceae bacterium]MDE6976279.1 GNAT family N-acetyltransferase [Lachnospiraceae bacterium]
MIQYRELNEGEITRSLFRDFVRHQKVTDCWRRVDGEWVVRADPFIDDWSEEEYEILVKCLRHTAVSGGLVYGGFYQGMLKGFVSVEPDFMELGTTVRYLDLSCIHVSEDMRGSGIGRTLFGAAKKWARQRGADKLYISAHSAVESQAFYKAMGCVEAAVYAPGHVEKEPYDCQLECGV